MRWLVILAGILVCVILIVLLIGLPPAGEA